MLGGDGGSSSHWKGRTQPGQSVWQGVECRSSPCSSLKALAWAGIFFAFGTSSVFVPETWRTGWPCIRRSLSGRGPLPLPAGVSASPPPAGPAPAPVSPRGWGRRAVGRDIRPVLSLRPPAARPPPAARFGASTGEPRAPRSRVSAPLPDPGPRCGPNPSAPALSRGPCPRQAAGIGRPAQAPGARAPCSPAR